MTDKEDIRQLQLLLEKLQQQEGVEFQDSINSNVHVGITPHAVLDALQMGIVDHGFTAWTTSVLSMNTNTFTITPNPAYIFWFAGTKFTKNTILTVNMTTFANGSWWIYFDSLGTIHAQDTPPDFTQVVTVAIIYKNVASTTPYLIFDERHSAYSNVGWHASAHLSIGAMINSGGCMASFSPANTPLMNMAAGELLDEDLFHQITAANPKAVRLLSRDVGGNWNAEAYGNQLWAGTGTQGQYDNGSGTLQNVTATNRFVNWVCAFNEYGGNGIIVFVSQAQYATLALAQAVTFDSLGLGNVPTPEIRPIYKLILQQIGGGTPHVEFIQADRVVLVGNVANGVASGTDHQTLSNRNVPNEHPYTSIESSAVAAGNMIISDGSALADGGPPPGAIAEIVLDNVKTIAQSIPSGGIGTLVLFESADIIDIDGWHDHIGLPAYFTAPVTGQYQVSVYILWDAAATTEYTSVEIIDSAGYEGWRQAFASTGAAVNPCECVSGPFHLGIGDHISVNVIQLDSGIGTLNINRAHIAITRIN